ncbi:hypothetical protein [Aurantiacibacter spongiae]|uniref:Uncharacterized protein n=1 Tax=Aurantiacibacter spongiae TaxID=2488860 RepID=A0A3N5CX44_9SPHN|nr:hypothetical protein [Aurantiacibacter spongiae]RPF71219.1 hypothetical protein EG799_06040 [Aurantiacibacter spongiae]
MTDNAFARFINNATLWRILFACFAAFVMLAPIIAMQFTGEVKWGPEDFIFAAIILAFVGAVMETILRASGQLAYRAAGGIALATIFVTIWANAAVGIIGNEDNPANILFAIPLAAAMIGALVARFRARGLAQAMQVTAVMQVAIFIAALVFWGAFIPVVTAIWTVAWLTSAWLFGKVARADDAAATGQDRQA